MSHEIREIGVFLPALLLVRMAMVPMMRALVQEILFHGGIWWTRPPG